MPPRILLIVYIHGFQGSSDTFGTFPSQITALLSHRLPAISIRHLIFPTFPTRGDLVLTVQKFRSWLEEHVIDLEVELGTASPTVDPGVGVVICGHSMGGIVGVEACLGIAGERVLSREGIAREEAKGEGEGDILEGAETAGNAGDVDEEVRLDGEKTTFLFPFVHGMLAFDTPYLGISPGVVAHGAEGHWKEGKAWYEGAVGLAGAFGLGAASKEAENVTATSPATAKMAAEKGLPSPGADEKKETQQTWTSKWGRTALLASAGLAATATLGTTAYLKRDTITGGFTWVSSHLEFVGCLARGQELHERVEKMMAVSQEREIGFANLYTLLGEDKGGGAEGRTFCNLPKEGSKVRRVFTSTRNEKVADEVHAHMEMFVPKENPGYYGMTEQALDFILGWVDKDAVKSSMEEIKLG